MKKTLVLLLALVFAISVIAAPPSKVDICHYTATGQYLLLNINENGLMGHWLHPDGYPGGDVPGMEGYIFSETCEVVPNCEYGFEPTGESYDGLYGSLVTPVEVTYEDCSTVEALQVVADQNFQQGQEEGVPAGWAGWSCVEAGYPDAIGGGIIPSNATIIDQGLAEFGADLVDGYSYPTYPHYTFNGGLNASGGEEGWVVEAAGATPPDSIYVLCTS